MLEGLFGLSFYGESTNPIFYVDHLLRMHRTSEDRIKDLIEHREKHFKIFVDRYEKKDFKIPEGRYQITFADMGFMHVSGPGLIKITYPKGLHLSLSEALFND